MKKQKSQEQLFCFSCFLSFFFHFSLLLFLLRILPLSVQKFSATSEKEIHFLSLQKIFAEKQFMDTDSQAEEEFNKFKEFIGERDTKQTSSKKEISTENNPSLDGKQEKYLSSFDSQFQDEIEGKSEINLSLQSQNLNPQNKKSGKSLNTLSKEGKMIEIEGGAYSQVLDENSPSASSQKKETKRSILTGSISNQGRGSFAVENSPLGKYQAKLSRLLESRWQSYCIHYREYIVPGILTVRFIINQKGDIVEIKITQTVKASEIQKGFTLRAIQESQFPPIPQKVLENEQAETLEFIFNFYFQ